MLGALVAARALRGEARALHAAERHRDLRFPGGIRELLDHAAVAVAAREVHAAVDPGGIALEHLLHEAHPLHERRPVECRAEAQAREHVGHRDLLRGLSLRLREDHALDGESLGAQPVVERGAEGGHPRPELAQTLHEGDHERPGQEIGQGREIAPLLEGGQISMGGEPVRAPVQEAVRDPPQALQERELERARPGPELAQGEGAHRLVGGEEAGHSVGVEAGVAVAQELLGHHLDARAPVVVPRDELGELPIVGGGQVVGDPRDLGLHEVEVVEKPLGRGREGLPLVHVSRQHLVGLAEAPVDLAQATQVGRSSAPTPARR